MVTINTTGKITTFTHRKYEVAFQETKKVSPNLKRACFVTMTVEGVQKWRLQYYYTKDSCSVEDIQPFPSKEKKSKTPSNGAAKELDFMMYCMEKHMQNQGIKLPTVRTHRDFARFLHRRNWKMTMQTGTAYNLEKDLLKRKIPAPSVMGGNWRKKRLAARRAIK